VKTLLLDNPELMEELEVKIKAASGLSKSSGEVVEKEQE